jgi:hypothetical protein
MLKGQGVRALDWMGRDLEKLGPRYRLAKWYREQMGMDVSIWNGTGYRALAKIADTGPIAWNEIAIRLPRTSGNTIKLRLSFIADNWHIDQIALAETGAHRSVRKIAVSEVHGANGEVLGAVLENLNHADDDYAIARPADYMRLHFDVGAPPEDAQRTWLLAAEGYYIEWMRREWLENREIHAFEPGDEAIMTALNLWKPRRDTMREQFEATRIRVR